MRLVEGGRDVAEFLGLDWLQVLALALEDEVDVEFL